MRLKRSLLLLGLLALYGTEARADPIVITQTGGYLFLSTTVDAGPPTLRLPPGFDLSGAGLRVYKPAPPAPEGNTGDVGNVPARDLCFSMGCAPGTLLSLNTSFSGYLGSSVVTLNGVTYNFVALNGTLNFVSPPIVLPDFGGGTGQLTVPFVFTGNMSGTTQAGATLFTATMSGQGLATFRFWEYPLRTGQWRLAEIEYRFQPVPEPATLVLLGTGLAGVGAALRRRRKAGRG